MQKLLIIDDETTVRMILSEHLSLEGYQVYDAENGEEGLEFFHRYEPHVIVLDLKMPKMGGVEFLQQLPSVAKIANSIIVLTGYGTHQDIKTCYQLGVHSFLRKPVNLFELKGVIKHAFAIRQYASTLEQEIAAKEEAYQQLEKEIQAKEAAYLQLEIEHKLLKNTFDGIAEGVVTLDHTFQIQRISEKVCSILGVAEEEAVGKPAASVLGAPIAGPTGALVNCVQQGRGETDIQTQLLCQSGAIIPIRLSITPLTLASMKEGWLLLFQDLREEERIMREKAGNFKFGRMISCDAESVQ